MKNVFNSENMSWIVDISTPLESAEDGEENGITFVVSGGR